MEAEWAFFSVWSSVLNREPQVSMLCIAIQVTRGRGEDLHDILVHLVLDADHSDDMYNYIYIYFAAMPIYWITCIQYTLYILYYIYYIHIILQYTLYIYIQYTQSNCIYIHIHIHLTSFNNIKLVMIYRRHVMHCTDRKNMSSWKTDWSGWISHRDAYSPHASYSVIYVFSWDKDKTQEPNECTLWLCNQWPFQEPKLEVPTMYIHKMVHVRAM